MNARKSIVWITRTGVFAAMIVAAQAATAGLGQTLVTGSIVNLLLTVAVMTCGPATGFTVAAMSPVMAKLAGIGPFWTLIPFIMAGNEALVLAWYMIARRRGTRSIIAYAAAALCAAGGKFAVMYLGVMCVAVPFLLRLTEQQAAVVSAMFSVTQMFTALIGGGAAALAVLPALDRALPRQGQN